MVRTKQTPWGGTSHQPGGMATAKFTGMGRGKATPKEQFRDDTEVDTKEDLPLVLKDAVQQPKEGKQGASKSKGKKKAQATEGAEDPHEETPSDPESTKPHTDPAPAEPQPGTSKVPTEDPTRPPPTKPPNPPPETPMKMNPQLPPSMSRRTKQQAKSG